MPDEQEDLPPLFSEALQEVADHAKWSKEEFLLHLLDALDRFDRRDMSASQGLSILEDLIRQM